MNKYKGVIFDFNGTLFFDNPKHILAWSKISQDIRHHGINGVPNNKVVEYMFGGRCDPSEMEKYSQLKEEYYRQFCKEDQATFHLVKGAEEYFDYLALGIKAIWNDEKLYFLLENGDLPAIIENQRLSKLKLRNMSNTYRENIAFLVNDIDKDIGEKKIKSIIKEL